MVLSKSIYEILLKQKEINNIKEDYKSLIPRNNIILKYNIQEKNSIKVSDKTISLSKKQKKYSEEIKVDKFNADDELSEESDDEDLKKENKSEDFSFTDMISITEENNKNIESLKFFDTDDEDKTDENKGEEDKTAEDKTEENKEDEDKTDENKGDEDKTDKDKIDKEENNNVKEEKKNIHGSVTLLPESDLISSTDKKDIKSDKLIKDDLQQLIIRKDEDIEQPQESSTGGGIFERGQTKKIILTDKYDFF